MAYSHRKCHLLTSKCIYPVAIWHTVIEITVSANPNNPSTITTWWQALAMIDWYMKAPVRYTCKNKKPMGNWLICQDEPYTVKAPCLVYSFGINWEFGFDDAMVKLGCEVHMFDPSMKEKDHMRGNATFHNMGIGSYNTDSFVPRHDIYVKDRQTWKVRTVKTIMKELGHQNRVIDVFKMDVETTEWTVIDNMLETDVFKFIRQFDVEYHLFNDYPLLEEYVHIYEVFTRLRESGFREYHSFEHQRTIKRGSFKYQADVAYVNAFFDKDSLSGT
ncbi:unnamed protein product [Candidula unifasciata]|uniref:Methyltransferase domain-containing protein n=1 Tax=Candidula unifasciata TaxID=100452 RepID=A0A8S3ZB89_9EUPU|nr:unnamed protein product [Candidula unifasciata]